MTLLAACLAFAACLSLALSQDRNWQLVAGEPPPARARTASRVAGWILLPAAFAICIAAEGAGFAALLWTLHVAVSSFLVAMIVSYAPGALRPIVRACSVLIRN